MSFNFLKGISDSVKQFIVPESLGKGSVMESAEGWGVDKNEGFARLEAEQHVWEQASDAAKHMCDAKFGEGSGDFYFRRAGVLTLSTLSACAAPFLSNCGQLRAR